MQQHDFNNFAKKIKDEGKLTTKQALDKFIKAMMQGPKLKIVKKKTIRSYENGIKKQSDGSEKCMTKASWQKRVDEVFVNSQAPDGWYECANFQNCQEMSEHRAHFEVDHIRKRSLGRDDRLINLQLLCLSCHRKKHDSFKHSGARA